MTGTIAGPMTRSGALSVCLLGVFAPLCAAHAQTTVDPRMERDTVDARSRPEVETAGARIGALLRNRAGEVMLIRRHGAKFAARVLTSHAGTRLDQGFLTLSTDDPHFGSITLDLGEQAQVWAASLRRLGASA